MAEVGKISFGPNRIEGLEDVLANRCDACEGEEEKAHERFDVAYHNYETWQAWLRLKLEDDADEKGKRRGAESISAQIKKARTEIGGKAIYEEYREARKALRIAEVATKKAHRELKVEQNRPWRKA